MAIYFYTDDPESVLGEMIRLVNQAPSADTSTFWYLDADAGFNHSAVQWDRVGSFIASPDKKATCIIFSYRAGEKSQRASVIRLNICTHDSSNFYLSISVLGCGKL